MNNLRNVFLVAIISFFGINSHAQSEITGEWVVGEKNTVAKIEQRDGVFEGKIISSDNPEVEMGKLFIKELKQIEGMWKGKVYSPKHEKWFDGEFVPKENYLTLHIMVGFVSKTVEWTKSKN